MRHRGSTAASRSDASKPRERALAGIIEDIERRSNEQSDDLAELRARVEALVADSEGMAVRLAEAERELGEARAALEKERGERERLVRQNGKLKEAVVVARAALDIIEPAGALGETEVAQETIAQPMPGAADEGVMMLLTDEERGALGRMAEEIGVTRGALVADICRSAIANHRGGFASASEMAGASLLHVGDRSP